MDHDTRDSLYTRTPIFYEPRLERGPCNRVLPGRVVDPRLLGPSVPRVLVCGIAFRLHGRYYIGNPLGPRCKGRSSVLLHRVVYAAVHGSIPEGHDIHHQDGNPWNTHPENLEALPRFVHRSSHKSEPRFQCKCMECGAFFGCYQIFGKTCSAECKRKWHARYERIHRPIRQARRTSLQYHS